VRKQAVGFTKDKDRKGFFMHIGRNRLKNHKTEIIKGSI
jgi:hypothetical protein